MEWDDFLGTSAMMAFLYDQRESLREIAEAQGKEAVVERMRIEGIKKLKELVEEAVKEYMERGGRICPFCKERVEENFLFCQGCGERLRIKCKGCGALIGKEVRFCPYCGVSIEELKTPPVGFCEDCAKVYTEAGVRFCEDCGRELKAVRLATESFLPQKDVKEKIKEAINGRKEIDIIYFSRSGESTARTIRPIEITQKGSREFVRAFCFLRKEERNFNLGRILWVKLHEEG
jgi:uncharacterized protein (UPF0212 family)